MSLHKEIEFENGICELMSPLETKKTNEESFGGNLPSGNVGAKK